MAARERPQTIRHHLASRKEKEGGSASPLVPFYQEHSLSQPRRALAPYWPELGHMATLHCKEVWEMVGGSGEERVRIIMVDLASGTDSQPLVPKATVLGAG